MKYTKITAVAMLLAAGTFGFADEFDEFTSEFEEYVEPTVTLSGSVSAAGRVYTDQRDANNEVLDLQDSLTEGNPSVKIGADYSGSSSDVSIKFKFDKFSLGDYKEDIVEEFTARAYLGNFQLEAGKMKVVWGKGDKLHVVDNFNANDYTDYIIPDYIDRRIAEPMFRVVYSTPSNVKLEGIWTPMMTADRLASDGVWVPNAMKTLTATVESAMKHNLKLTLNNAISTGDSTDAISAIMAASSFSSDNLVRDDIHSIKFGQAGARTTFTLGHLDLGLSYYYGHSKQPSANLSPYIDSFKNATSAYAAANAATIQTTYEEEITNLATNKYAAYYTSLAGQTVKDPVTGADVTIAGATEIQTLAGHAAFAETCENHAQEWYAQGKFTTALANPELNYDQVQVFGLEMATVLWKFNIRAEGAYYLTKDTAGDNPWIHNNSVQWVAGFDIDMPWTNMNLNVQTQGKYILNSDKIKDGAYAAYDVDKDANDKYTNNKIVVNLSDSYNHDNVKVELSGIYGIERKDILVMPSLTIRAADDFSIKASGLWIHAPDEDCEFYGWGNNSFAQLSCKYLF
ncbi:MAG: hypothetical protein IJJ70_00910 [Treponema sp.]|nr:hypothetical protein [Treponema sp.]